MTQSHDNEFLADRHAEYQKSLMLEAFAVRAPAEKPTFHSAVILDAIDGIGHRIIEADDWEIDHIRGDLDAIGERISRVMRMLSLVGTRAG